MLKEPSYVCSRTIVYAEEYTNKFFVIDDAKLLMDLVQHQAWKVACLEQILDYQKPLFFFHEHDTMVCFFGTIVVATVFLTINYLG